MRVAVVGVGAMGQNHARVYSEIAELVGVADADVETAKRTAKRFGGKAVASVQELLKLDPEAVTIATPTESHLAVASELLDAGVHVLVEKPLAPTVAEAERLDAKARATGLTLGVGHIERHNPVVKFAKDAMEKGSFGRLVTIVTRRVSSYPQRIKDVGVVFDLGTHDIDAALHLAGQPVESVVAAGGSFSTREIEDHAGILLRFKGGATAFIEVNWLTPFKVRRISLTCSEAYVELDYISQQAEVSSSKFLDVDQSNLYQVPQEHHVRKVSIQKEEPLRNELLDFLDAIARKRSPLVSGRDGVRVLRVAEAAVESISKKKIVELDRG